MYNCFDIAKKFVYLSKEEDISMTPMKLLKLTYIAHGYYLAFSEKPLFSNTIEAWKYGPVIPDLYHIIKRVDFSSNDFNFIEMYSQNNLSKDDDKFIEAVWNAYKKFDGSQLSSKTHEKNTPWDKTFNGQVFTKINDGLIKEYYQNKVNG
ncbi:Panacea domain-containing protein [Tenacibaculum salmonis]|uniref:Panacea domain-containing protein n=1 Tax=Tenacibaculum sp. P3-BQ1 TaxID=3232310 RepID=UPI0034DFE5D3